MSPSTPPRTNPLFVGILILCAFLAIFLVRQFVSALTTILFVALVIVGLYEGWRFLTLLRGGVPPPSSLGLVRGVGRIGWKGMRTLPAFVRWGGRTAYVMAHSTHEIAVGAVLGGSVGLAVGWNFGMLIIGILLGLGVGVTLGTYVGKRKMRNTSAQPPGSGIG